MAVNSAVETAYMHTDPKDYTIEDVFHIVNSRMLGNQYLEKASKTLRLQACLLLVDQDLPLPPAKIMEFAGMSPKEGVFKVKKQADWQQLVAALKKLQKTSAADVLKKIGSEQDQQSLKERLETLGKEFQLPFSEDNVKYFSRKLALDFNNSDLRKEEVYVQLAEYREWTDYLLELLKDPVSAEQEKDADSLTLFDALIGCNLPAFKRLLADGKEDPTQQIGQKPLLYYTLNPILVNNDIRFFNALASQLEELPVIGSRSLLELILSFKCERRNIETALDICGKQGLVWDFDRWEQQLINGDMDEKLLLLLAERQKEQLLNDLQNSQQEEQNTSDDDAVAEDETDEEPDVDEFLNSLQVELEDDSEKENADDVPEEEMEINGTEETAFSVDDDDDLSLDDDDDDTDYDELLRLFKDDDDDDDSEPILERESVEFQNFIRFLKSGISKGGSAVKVCVAFIDPQLKNVLSQPQQKLLLKNLSPSEDVAFPCEIAVALMRSGLFDEQLENFNPKDITKEIMGEEVYRSRKSREAAAELSVWVEQFKKDCTPESLTDFLLAACLRYREIGRRELGYAESVLKLLAEKEKEECFLLFAGKFLANPENLKSHYRRHDPLCDFIKNLPYAYVKKMQTAGLINSAQLDDDTIAELLKEMDVEEFAAFVKGNFAVDMECLNAAAAAGKVDILEYMLDQLRIPVNGKNSGCWSRADVLSEAAKTGKAEVLRFVLRRYPEMLTLRDDDGLLPIHRAVKNSDSDVSFEDVKACLTILCGGNDEESMKPDLLNAVSPEGSPLTIAVAKREYGIARFLLDSGADVNINNLVQKGGIFANVDVDWMEEDDRKFIEKLITRGADVNTADSDGNTVFSNFSFSEDTLPLFEKLLKKADPSTVRKRNYEGANVLHKLYEDASSDDSEKESRKRERLTRKLVQEFGVDINAVNFSWRRDRSVFMTAVSNGNIADLKSLIKLGADPFGKGHSGRDALMELVDNSDHDMEKLKFLVEEVKLPLTAIDDEGKNVLCFAMNKDKQDYFDYLVKKGADFSVIDKKNKNLLWYACSKRNFPLFERLLTEYNLNAGVVSEDGTIAFELIKQVWCEHLPLDEFDRLCRLCIAHGLDINACQKSRRRETHIIQYAVEKCFDGTIELLKILWDMPGIRCPERNSNGETLLHLLANGNDDNTAKVARFLIEERNMSVSEPDGDGNWPLHIAADSGNENLCEVLWKSNPNSVRQRNNDGEIPLYNLIWRSAEKFDLIRKFIETYDSDINWTDQDGETLLDYYLRDSDSTCEGMAYFLSKGVRCTKFNWLAEKDISFVKLYIEEGCQGNVSGLIAQLDAGCLKEILENGQIQTLQFLIANGMSLWQYFPNENFLKDLSINEHTADWLRLFFIDWQWPRAYLTIKDENGENFLNYFIREFDANCLPALKILWAEIGVTDVSPREFLEKLSDRIEVDSDKNRIEGFLNEEVLAYFIDECGIDPTELPPPVFALLLSQFDSPEIFANAIDKLAEMVGGENVSMEIRDGSDEEKTFPTTLLHAAVSGKDKDNVFTLRYLIEKHQIIPGDTRDGLGRTVLECAVQSGNVRTVHYLLSRFETSEMDLNKALIKAAEADKKDVVYLLCENYGADPTYKDNYGKRAEIYTSEEDIKAYLIRKVAEKSKK